MLFTYSRVGRALGMVEAAFSSEPWIAITVILILVGFHHFYLSRLQKETVVCISFFIVVKFCATLITINTFYLT